MVGWPDSEGLITIDLVEKRVPARRSVLNMEEALGIRNLGPNPYQYKP